MLVLVISHFHVKWINKTFETSRWIMVFAMFLLASHYVLQMALGLRDQGDDIAATVNILFYAPVAILITYSIFHLECNRRNRFRYRVASIVTYLLILAIFGVGYLIKGNMHLNTESHIMLLVLEAYIIAAVAILWIIKTKKQKIINQEIGGDVHTYINYTHATFIILSGASLMTSFTIFSRTLLIIAAPFFLIAMVLFVTSFLALGHNLQPMKSLLNNEDSSLYEPDGQPVPQKLSDNRSRIIAEAINNWCAEKGFRDSSITITALSQQINIERHELSLHLGQHHNCSFRIWLSDLRFKEAKRLMLEHPEYSNEASSAECGSSSRAQLYNIFRSKTGMSPREWAEHNISEASCE